MIDIVEGRVVIYRFGEQAQLKPEGVRSFPSVCRTGTVSGFRLERGVLYLLISPSNGTRPAWWPFDWWRKKRQAEGGEGSR